MVSNPLESASTTLSGLALGLLNKLEVFVVPLPQSLSSHSTTSLPANMCQWYSHIYTCKHTTYALGKYCEQGNLVQTPCKQKNIWQAIGMDELCEECAERNEGDENSTVVKKEPELIHKKGSGKIGRKK
jgi:hypothetical protein